MTDNEIIKALDCCSEASPIADREFTMCGIPSHIVCKRALDLINRQKVENERLVLIIDEIEYDHHRWVQEASIIRGEAIKETVETVKKNSCCSSIFVNGEEKESSRIYQISEAELDELVKEMVGNV
jgi:hypothetical protein